MYCSTTQTLTTGSSAEAKFVAVATAAKVTHYLRCVLKQLFKEQTEPTDIFINILLALKIVNDNFSTTEHTRYKAQKFFAIKDWREGRDVITNHIQGVLNP